MKQRCRTRKPRMNKGLNIQVVFGLSTARTERKKRVAR